MSEASIERFPARGHDKLRYGDTDRQGHVNNAVFASLFETGRVEVLHEGGRPLADEGCDWVLARIELDYVDELTWSGRVDIGTGVVRLGRTSLTLGQALFEDGRLAARARTVVVQVDATTRRPAPLSESVRARCEGLVLANP